ncbi:unannotated protein [freshwater metagenome]|uniref:Unannotated protein n=1 Tax=freshwater metagenome TaxID=449393 RepID=A0A6J7UAW0_9ZZZZ
MHNPKTESESSKEHLSLHLKNYFSAYLLQNAHTLYQEYLDSFYPLLCGANPHDQVRIQLPFGQLPLLALDKQSIHKYRQEFPEAVRRALDELDPMAFSYSYGLHNLYEHLLPWGQVDRAL